jgi:beta-lactamase superfamily II metal-dependent hydrolase
MLFTLEALKAKEGDCLLLHWGDPAAPKLAVIDGGPGNVYEDFLRPRLEEIRHNRGLQQLPVELAMVSHIDADHIVGIKKLFARLKTEVEDNDDKPLQVKRLWHNTFDDIIGNQLNAHYKTFTASFEAAANGEPKADSVDAIKTALEARTGLDPDDASHTAFDIGLILAGHADGRKLRDDHRFLFQQGQIQALNKPFTKTLITAELTPGAKAFQGIKITIVGPLQAEIDALQADFDAYLNTHGLATGQAALAAYADKSIPNLSSIVCLVESASKTILLTGDARGDKILAGLRQAGLLGAGAAARLHVNILKAPHHGSDRNVEPAFFKAITADTYVFSGDGKHGNPERDTIEWVIASRGKNDDYRLVFTYPIDTIDTKRKAEAKHWDAAKDSLRALLDAKKGEGYRFVIEEDAPIAIDLGTSKLTD